MTRFHPALRTGVATAAVLLALTGCAETATRIPSTPSAAATAVPAPTATGSSAVPTTAAPSTGAPSGGATTDPGTPAAPAAPAGPPALSDLVLTPDGLIAPGGAGSLLVGQPIPTDAGASALAAFDADFCTPAWEEAGVEVDGAPGRWVPNYPDETQPGVMGRFPFGLLADEQTAPLRLIVVSSPALRTAGGAGIGSTRAELEAALAGTAQVTGTDDPVGVDAYTVRGANASLTFEVGNGTDVVELAHVGPLLDVPLTLWGTDAGPYGCSLV
ncbi:hypothetical protein [Rathayibacter sp. VKM Ac-2630]|uniref:hypothetical protein n=1 Tax=Rathayibacter sp. VKM Ac-2630 TaxID=1938617 RepID=UPI0009D40E7C|nr:hypothetical protein [Rathayibacter sp. VKM Ac-2630]OOB89232.1 hypothetical protein B0T42_18720 [Rathayibacter sp. VKM Ac-2630]